jgi:hypothetical protein
MPRACVQDSRPRTIVTRTLPGPDARRVLPHDRLAAWAVAVIAATPATTATTVMSVLYIRVLPGLAWLESGWASVPQRPPAAQGSGGAPTVAASWGCSYVSTLQTRSRTDSCDAGAVDQKALAFAGACGECAGDAGALRLAQHAINKILFADSKHRCIGVPVLETRGRRVPRLLDQVRDRADRDLAAAEDLREELGKTALGRARCAEERVRRAAVVAAPCRPVWREEALQVPRSRRPGRERDRARQVEIQPDRDRYPEPTTPHVSRTRSYPMPAPPNAMHDIDPIEPRVPTGMQPGVVETHIAPVAAIFGGDSRYQAAIRVDQAVNPQDGSSSTTGRDTARASNGRYNKADGERQDDDEAFDRDTSRVSGLRAGVARRDQHAPTAAQPAAAQH